MDMLKFLINARLKLKGLLQWKYERSTVAGLNHL